MGTDTADELEQLRARAYGPAADIHTDVAAQQRLRELEALARASGSPREAPAIAAADPRAVGEQRRQEPVDAPPAVETLVDEQPDEPVDEAPVSRDSAPAPRTRRLSRTVRLLWVGSVLAAAAIAAVCTYGLVAITPVSVSSGAPQIATLRPQALVEVPAGWFGAGPSSRTWEFYGLTLFETTTGMFGGTGDDCLMVITTADIPAEGESTDNWTVSGLSNGACSVGGFPATIEVRVDSSVPEELRATFPDSALQFVKRGDEIGVFQDKG
ncbi:MAG: hypothetical protein ACTHNQ_04060 [Microbacterium sp.]|uniref:hypothetical protein n=1 Tax=Microbacterium sp. TaxID=51671 RepID=UPI003F7EACF5